ncbi:unnamed protein product [marine sediment metagenome]|uniref:Transketolase-like pyrimidine-binding domain-containing protein n=1 Tax=marine sediment metagenome TaxID=412755 RepID=X1F7L2_9ZZZZ
MKNTINSPQLMSTRDAYGQVLVEIGKEQKNIVVLNADLSQSTRTSLFAETFPERFFNAGIAEQNMMGVAAGLATTGFIPVVSTLAIFAAGRAYDQVRNTIVHSGLNVKIVATHSGITMGKDGSSHQSIEDIALMRVIPDMTVIVPADALETKKALRATIEYKGPVYIITVGLLLFSIDLSKTLRMFFMLCPSTSKTFQPKADHFIAKGSMDITSSVLPSF